MASTTPVFKIVPTTQQYDWGKIGTSAKVAQFAAASGFTIDSSAPYAELWMGTHPNAPSRVASSGQALSEHLASHPELIGKRVAEKFDASNGNLPFLFKVLSIQKALSIQSHPDKATAEKLHAQHPDIYKDPNHKPEMALAITPFRAMCGFQPLLSIATFLNNTPEFAALIPESIRTRFIAISNSPHPTGPAEKAALRDVFSAVMTAGEDTFVPQLDTLVRRYNAHELNPGEEADVVDLVLRLDSQFPRDIGIFCAFLLNHVVLSPGEAIFLGAGEPHAYVSGECMECMANSDNVIRAGLTPKLRDIPNLVSGLTYTASPPLKHFVHPSVYGPLSTLYDPPAPEFAVVQVRFEPGKREGRRGREVHAPVGGPSIAIVTGGAGVVGWGGEGEGELGVGVGDVFFVGAETEVSFTAGEGQVLVVYRAFVDAE
ncbi:mannose-6-phosphate isomerase [Lyophyllum atratum]|nr:mannose-6-phosphate isomerase [Lyophyllum atratum]